MVSPTAGSDLGGDGMPEGRRADGVRTRLRLLGGWQLVVDGDDVPLHHREQRLVALLGLTGRRPRAQVAGTLWPESTDARALASLRRAVLQTQQQCPGLLQADRTEVGLDPDVEVDVDDVRRAAVLTELPMPGDEAEALLATLVGEPLLPAWYDDWVLPERERLEQARVRALEQIARHAFGIGDLVQAVDAARAAVDIEPLSESARELMIRAHLGQGDRGAAVREFQRYRDRMRDELGVPPSVRIVRLVEPLLDLDGERGPRAGVGPAGTGRAGAGHTGTGLARAGPAAAGGDPDGRPARHAPGAATPGRRRRRPRGVPFSLPGPDAPPEDRGPGNRVLGLRLVAAAAVVLVASVAVAGGGAGGDDEPDGRRIASPPSETEPGPVEEVREPREVLVQPGAPAVGRAALRVHATRRPATVRVVVRGPAGLSVVRHVVVRNAGGRRLVMDGLDPGTYRWQVTSPTAVPVTGRVRVSEPPAPVDAAPPDPASTPSGTTASIPAPTQAPTTTSTTTAPTTPSSTPDGSAVRTPPAPQPTQQPAPAPTRAPQPTQPAKQPTKQPTRQPTTQPAPSQGSGPTGSPSDPGTVAPTPVG